MSASGGNSVLTILIVDDEPLARVRLRDLLSDLAGEIPNEVVGEAENGVVAIDMLNRQPVDVVLTDIRMPVMDGVELARHIAGAAIPTAIVFVTAYENHAVEAFELNAIDYLVKPVRLVRLAAALKKVQQLRSVPQIEALIAVQEGARSHLSCHERGRLLLVSVRDVLYFRADLKYVVARTVAREYLLDEALSSLEEEFSAQFIRLHRSVIVAKSAIAGFEKCGTEGEAQWQAIITGVAERLPVSRRQWPMVKGFAKHLSVK